ncbi:MAG: DUF3341 domain-containing protein [Acidobacteriota bacterium]
MAQTKVRPPFYGVIAEFLTPQELHDAIVRVREEGYRKIDAFLPYPVEEICHEICDHKKSAVSKLVLLGGLSGGSFGFLFQSWAMGAFPTWVYDWSMKLFNYTGYPFDIGGRPYFSWPAFIPITFELTILFGAFSAVIGMFALNGLPQPYHPVFNVEGFERATVDRFFLLIESEDPRFDRDEAHKLLGGLGPQEVQDVDW